MALLLLAAAFLGGTAAGAAGLHWAWAISPVAAVAAGLASGRRFEAAALACLCLASLTLGYLRYEGARPEAEPLAGWPGGVVAFRGAVSGEPEERSSAQRFPVRVTSVLRDGAWREVDAGVLVTARPFPSYGYGDLLELRGIVETPPSFPSFDYREYLARNGIAALAAYPVIKRTGTGGGSAIEAALIDARAPLSAAVRRSLPEPESALARGLLLGERASIPREVNDTLNRAGLSHLIAISGYNVTLIAGFTIGALGWLLGRRRAALVAVPVVLGYAVFVGASPPVLRAALMGALMLGALLAGRPGSAGTAVALAGAAMVAIEPLAMDDVSFQMSFLATLGLIYLSEPIARLLEGRLVGRVPAGLALWASEAAGVTLAASLAVLPVTAAAFGRVSLVALPANLAVLPLFPLMLLTSALTALAGALWAPPGDAIGLVAEAAIGYLTAAAAFFAGLPLATLSVDDFGSREALLFYAAAGGVAVLLLRFAQPAAREEGTRPAAGLPVLAAAVVAAAAIAVWTGALAPSPRLTVAVLDVGQGDAIFVRTPAGHRILVDGGPGGERLAQALGPHLRPGERRLDLVVLTHPQDDHVTGLVEALRRFEVGLVLAPPTESDTAAFAAFRSESVTQGVSVRAARAGERVDLGRGAWLEVLAPPAVLLRGTPDDLNNNSIVLRLGLGGVSFLLTGDLAEPGERALLNSPGTVRATVLKVGHHGSDGSTSEAFLQAVRPAAAVVSAGATNPFGHPSPTTLRRLAGIPLYSTMANGSVRFETDGRRLWSRPERGGARLIDLAGGR